MFQLRYDPLDVSVCVVRGTFGLLVTDTRSSHREADELQRDLRRLFGLPVRWVANTHAHFDHCFGNYLFGGPPGREVPSYGHERMPAHLDEYETPMLARWVGEVREAERAAELREIVVTPPTELVSDRHAIDLGDRAVSLSYLGRGHTDNDLLVHVPDAAAWLVGDLVEESGPPAYGPDCFPLDWPETIQALREQLEQDAVLIPGHGAAVGPAFVAEQHAGLEAVAGTVRELRAAGVPEELAGRRLTDRVPYSTEQLGSAVSRGYRQLAR